MDKINLAVYIAMFILAAITLYILIADHHKKDSEEIATVIVKLENISSGVDRIENEITNLKEDQRRDHDLLIKVEASAKSAHNRIDIFQTGKGRA